MRTPLPGPALVLGLLLAAPSWAMPEESATRSAERGAEDHATRFAALVADYDVALEAFYEASAALPEGAAPEDLPQHPAETYHPRFRRLAKAGSIDAAFWCLNSGRAGVFGDFVELLGLAVSGAPGDERLGVVLSGLHKQVPGPSAELLEVLDAYAASAPGDELGYAALRAKGTVLTMDPSDADGMEEGLALLEGLLELDVSFPGKEEIPGQLFRLKNLAVGMMAPDWTATDIDGQPIALSDYRGKVTILDFWGFW